MTSYFRSMLVFTISFVAVSAGAQTLRGYTKDPNFYRLQKAEIVEVDEATIPAPLLRGFQTAPALDFFSPQSRLDEIEKTVDKAEIVFDKIVNLGKKVYDFVAQGRAVANIETNVSTALPEGTKSWRDFSNWQRPVSKTYRLTRKNMYGWEVINLLYRVTYVYGGNYGGVGSYIAYATVEPVQVNVWYGFKLDAKASTPLVYNVGSKDQPIGAMNLKIEYSVGSISPFQGIDKGSSTYFVSGRGQFFEVK